MNEVSSFVKIIFFNIAQLVNFFYRILQNGDVLLIVTAPFREISCSSKAKGQQYSFFFTQTLKVSITWLYQKLYIDNTNLKLFLLNKL